MSIDHVGLKVTDLERSKNFYSAALKPLGYSLLMDLPQYGAAGFGTGGKPDFWLGVTQSLITPVHVAISATRAQIDEFHRAALDAGGRDNGPPGLREMYHPNYYGAFILDPDGNNIEAVCHASPEAVRSVARAARKAKTAVKTKAAVKAKEAVRARPKAKSKSKAKKPVIVKGTRKTTR